MLVRVQKVRKKKGKEPQVETSIATRRFRANTVNSIFHFTHMLKASGCLEVKEWELGDLKDTKSGQLHLLASGMGFFSSENDPLAYFFNVSSFFHASWYKSKKLTFSQRMQKRSKLSENDIYIYLRIFQNYGAKQPSQKKVMRVQKYAFLAVKTEKTAKNGIHSSV